VSCASCAVEPFPDCCEVSDDPNHVLQTGDVVRFTASLQVELPSLSLISQWSENPKLGKTIEAHWNGGLEREGYTARVRVDAWQRSYDVPMGAHQLPNGWWGLTLEYHCVATVTQNLAPAVWVLLGVLALLAVDLRLSGDDSVVGRVADMSWRGATTIIKATIDAAGEAAEPFAWPVALTFGGLVVLFLVLR